MGKVLIRRSEGIRNPADRRKGIDGALWPPRYTKYSKFFAAGRVTPFIYRYLPVNERLDFLCVLCVSVVNRSSYLRNTPLINSQ
jgi:hypothetical protein